MDILQTFVFNNSQHKVHVIRNENDEPLFRASDIGKVLGIGNIHPSISDFDHDDKVINFTNTPGGKQEATFLTEQGVLRLIMRSRKPIAKPFQKWVFNVIKEIRKTGKYELQKEISQLKEGHENLFRRYKDEEDVRIHKTLVEGFDNKTVVYFGKIKTMEDGRELIKIGCTKNIRPRTTGLQAEFGSMSIFKVFECDHHEPFERFLHEHIDIRRYSFKELINGKKGQKVSNEVYCMTENQRDRAINIAMRNVSQFRIGNKRDFDGLEMNDDVDSMDVQYPNKRGRCTLTGPKIQAYSEDGSSLIKTYETLIDASRDLNLGSGSRHGITEACEKRTVRYGYRWAQLDRKCSDDTFQSIGDTVQNIPIRTGLVAGMNDDKSEIMKIYTSFKACARENGFVSQGAVQKRIKRGATVGGHHIVCWSDIPEPIQDRWLEHNSLPQVSSNAKCFKINRLDPVTGKVLRTYGTMNEVIMKFKMNPRTLKCAIKGDLIKHGFKWAYAD